MSYRAETCYSSSHYLTLIIIHTHIHMNMNTYIHTFILYSVHTYIRMYVHTYTPKEWLKMITDC